MWRFIESWWINRKRIADLEKQVQCLKHDLFISFDERILLQSKLDKVKEIINGD